VRVAQAGRSVASHNSMSGFNLDSKVSVAHLTRPILASRTDFAQYSKQRGVLGEGAGELPACQGSSAELQSAAVRLRDCGVRRSKRMFADNTGSQRRVAWSGS